MKRGVGWVLVAALVAVSLTREREPATSGLLHGLLGPVAGAAASVQWTRVNDALRAGRPELALARAETALELDPGATGGWKFLCNALAFDLASAQREPDPRRRAIWIRAAFELAARGERSAREPGELAFWQGLVKAHFAAAEDLPWPDGAQALWTEAAADFERASALGVPVAQRLGEGMRRPK